MTQLAIDVLDSIDEANDNQWDNVVAQSNMGTVFQRTGWLRAVERGLDVQPKHVVARKDGNPVAVWPNYVAPVDAPFALPSAVAGLGLAELSSVSPGFGGPLVRTDTDDVLDGFFDAVDRICDGQCVAHRVRFLDPDHVKYATALRERRYQPSLLHCRLALELDDYDRVRDDMDKERRKELRDALDRDPRVEEADVDRDAARAFHREYRRTIDRVDGVAYPASFFEALADHLRDRVEIFTAHVDGEPAGKHLYLRDDEQDALHYFFAGVDDQYFEYSTPTVLHDYAIRWALRNDYRTLDFGESPASYRDGTFTYKRKFGAAVEPVYEWERGYAPVRWRAYRAARQLYLRYRDDAT